jgi:hypothetical protein
MNELHQWVLRALNGDQGVELILRAWEEIVKGYRSNVSKVSFSIWTSHSTLSKPKERTQNPKREILRKPDWGAKTCSSTHQPNHLRKSIEKLTLAKHTWKFFGGIYESTSNNRTENRSETPKYWHK